MAYYSNFGAKSVDLGAPGDFIWSTYMAGGYEYLSGTSMASPHVAGAAAMIYGYRPTYTYPMVRETILKSARRISSLAGRTRTGGTLDLAAAVKYNLRRPVAPKAALASLSSPAIIYVNWQGVRQAPWIAPEQRNHTYIDSKVAPDSWYCYRMKAKNAAGVSGYSAVAASTTSGLKWP